VLEQQLLHQTSFSLPRVVEHQTTSSSFRQVLEQQLTNQMTSSSFQRPLLGLIILLSSLLWDPHTPSARVHACNQSATVKGFACRSCPLLLVVVIHLLFLAWLGITICGPFALFWLITLVSLVTRRWIAWVTLKTATMTVSTLVVVVVAVATREVTAADVTVIDVFWFLSAQQHTLPYSAAIQLSGENAELRRGHSCLPTHVRGC
jgi:hypothetical protein